MKQDETNELLADLEKMESYLILNSLDEWTPEEAEDAFNELEVIE